MFESAAECWCKTGTGPRQGPCLPCEVGKFRSLVRTPTCIFCQAHSSSLPGSTHCQCNTGYFNDDNPTNDPTTSSTCHACSANKYRCEGCANSFLNCVNCINSESPIGSLTIADCHCSAGWTGEDGSVCAECTSGKYKHVIGSGV